MNRPLGCALFAVLAAGCSAPLATVSGNVTLKGAPVPEAVLSFQPSSNPDDAFPGTALDSGEYRLSYRDADGMPPGRYRVTVTRAFVRGGKTAPGGEEGEELKANGRALTETYSFEKDVAAGPNTIDFELSQGTRVKE
jgi:hypothetical protein